MGDIILIIYSVILKSLDYIIKKLAIGTICIDRYLLGNGSEILFEKKKFGIKERNLLD